MVNEKPSLSFWQIWNMCFGFLGIQFGFALQNANISRIFQTLGADMDTIPLLWIAGPVTGLLVQPIVGHLSDNTWNRLGRRRPFFLIGAIFTSLSLLVLPNSSVLWVAAGMLWIPDTVKYAFYVGALVLFVAVGWTIISSREYSPEQLAAFAENEPESQVASVQRDQSSWMKSGLLFFLPAAVGTLLIWVFGWDKQLYILSIGLMLFALAQWMMGWRRQRHASHSGFDIVMDDLFAMPVVMRQLAWVQFFSWFALFAMWIYTTAAVTSHHYGTDDAASELFNDGANWVGVLFAAYNGFAALAAIIIPVMVKQWGLRMAHGVNLLLGALGLLSFLWIQDPQWLLLSMVGIGFAWASILSLPYAMLAGCLPVNKMGVYMGIFNFFIVIPQLLAASVLGLLLRYGFDSNPLYAMVIGAVSFSLAAVMVVRVKLQNGRPVELASGGAHG